MRELVDRLWVWMWEPETDQQRAARNLRDWQLERILVNACTFLFLVFLLFLLLLWVL